MFTEYISTGFFFKNVKEIVSILQNYPLISYVWLYVLSILDPKFSDYFWVVVALMFKLPSCNLKDLQYWPAQLTINAFTFILSL